MLLLLGSLGLLLGPRAPPRAPRAAIVAALDYKDPVVAEEFQACQALDTEAVEDELAASGIPVPPTMNDMEMRMMLVEMRLRKSGKVGPQKAMAKAKPGADASAFELALYEKPAFSELYEEWKAARNTNAANLAIEHVNNARRAKERYGGTALYDETIAKIEAALNARVVKEVKGGALSYAGFPANMGEAGVRMTLAAFGDLKDFTWAEADDGLTCGGTVEYEDVDTAKAAIDKYDGMDMGLGTTLTLEPQ